MTHEHWMYTTQIASEAVCVRGHPIHISHTPPAYQELPQVFGGVLACKDVQQCRWNETATKEGTQEGSERAVRLR